jgi:hypothetical protein
MNYIDKFKYIYENYYIASIEEEYLVDNVLIASGTNFFNDIFSNETYTIDKKGNTFHNKEVVNYLNTKNKDNHINFRHALNTNKKVILQCGLHLLYDFPTPLQTTKEFFFDKLFSSYERVVEKMRKKELVLFIYQGWEAENLEDNLKAKTQYSTEKYRDYYDMFESILKEYNLPKSSMVFLSSNLYGNDIKTKYNFNVIYDNSLELATFLRLLPENIDMSLIDIDYSFDEYLENVKTNNSIVCRLNRTKHPQRDLMLYYLHRLELQDKSIIDHKFFNEDNILRDGDFFDKTIVYCNENKKLSHLKKYFDVRHTEKKYWETTYLERDKKILSKIQSDLPYVASPYERKEHTIHSNLPIPYDVYKKSIFSWVSTSLPDKEDMMFLNQSTFNPILFYHPVLWYGYRNTTKYFKDYGFKSYDWLFESENIIDTSDCKYERFVYNIYEIDRISNMSRDELYNKIKDNKDTLIHNRNLLIDCLSIERIMTKFYEMINETEI